MYIRDPTHISSEHYLKKTNLNPCSVLQSLSALNVRERSSVGRQLDRQKTNAYTKHHEVGT